MAEVTVRVSPPSVGAMTAFLTGTEVTPSLEQVGAGIRAGRPVEGMSMAEMEYGFAELIMLAHQARDRLRAAVGLEPAPDPVPQPHLDSEDSGLLRTALAYYANRNPQAMDACSTMIGRLLGQ